MNRLAAKILGWITLAIMAAVAIALFATGGLGGFSRSVTPAKVLIGNE